MIKTKNNSKTMKKTVAVISCLALLSGIFYPLDLRAAVLSESGSAKEFTVPVSAGKITTVKYYDSRDIVINIQDLHCHGEVQRNIAKIIGGLDEKYELKNIFLEGASGDLDTTLLTSMTGKEFGKDAVETMVDMGYMGGAEYYSVSSGKNGFVKGIEDERLYTENIELLNEIMETEAEVEKMCAELVKEIKPVKREYANKDVSGLNRLVNKFERGSINSAKYYSMLLEMAEEKGIDTNKYKNINGYAVFSKSAHEINSEKTSKQFSVFLNILKQKISYKEFAELSDRSGNFANVEEISSELGRLAGEYNIIEINKLYHVKNFLNYLEFGRSVNPMHFAAEEKELKEELYGMLGRTKYEQEVIFLSEFIPTIKGYFTANITPEELKSFESDFARFKRSWCAYFPENRAKHLDIYARLLRQYHDNNLKRDSIFADFLIGKTKKNSNAELSGSDALAKINAEAGRRNMKVVVTGGFHSSGLEKIFQDNKISYVIITPKVTKNTGEAYDVYKNTIKRYRDFKESAINIKPFAKEKINESLPKLMSVSFVELAKPKYKGLSLEERKEGVREFIQDFIANHKTGDVGVESFKIDSYTKKGMTFSVVYKNKTTNNIIGERKYEAAGGKVFEITDNDVSVPASTSETMSVFDGVFKRVLKDVRFKAYEIITAFIVPVAEEFVFRYLPFAGALLLTSNPLSAVPILITSVVGIGIFTYVHYIADKIAVKTGRSAETRNVRRILFSSAALNIVFLSASVFLPGGAFAALGITVGLHALNNLLAVMKKIKSPVLFIFNAALDKLGSAKDDNAVIAENMQEVMKTLEDYKNGYYYGQYGDEQKAPILIYESIINEFKNVRTDGDLLEFAIKLDEVIGKTQGFSPYIKSNSAYIVIGMAALKNISDERVIQNAGEIFSRMNNHIHKEIFLKLALPFSAQIYAHDKKLAMEMLKELNRPRATYTDNDGRLRAERLLDFPEIITNIKDARKNLPLGWSAIVKDEELADFYGYFGTLFIVPGYRLKNASVESDENTLNSLYEVFKNVGRDSQEYEVLVMEIKRVINELFIKAENSTADNSSNIRIAETLGKLASVTILYDNLDLREALDADRINRLFRSLNIESQLITINEGVYIKSFTGENNDGFKNEEQYLDKFNYTPFISLLPDSVFDSKIIALKAPVLMESKGKTENSFDMSGKLKRLSDVNIMSLEKRRVVNENSSETEINEYFSLLSEMARILSEINEEHGNMAMKALTAMKSGEIPKTTLFKSKIGEWHSDKLDEIVSIHTFINAVHQTSINDVRDVIRAAKTSGDKVRTYSAVRDGIEITAHDTSISNSLNPEVKKLITKLAFSGISPSTGFIVDKDLLVWSVTFSAHSADMFFNFNDKHKEISISFQDSDDRIGNSRRMYYYRRVLEPLGFEVSIERGERGSFPRLNAKLSKDSGLNEKTDLSEIAYKVIDLFQHSTNFDFSLDGNVTESDIDKLVAKFNAGEIRYGYKPKGEVGAFSGKIGMLERMPNPSFGEAGKTLNKILTYLGLETIPAELDNSYLEQVLIDKYFNIPMKRAFISGKAILDESGVLAKNNEYNIKKKFADKVFFDMKGVEEASVQSQLLNQISYNALNLQPEFAIGAHAVGKSGFIEVDGGYISILASTDKVTHRIEMAVTEFVDTKGNRKEMTSKELFDMLNNNGFVVVKMGKKRKGEINSIFAKYKSRIERNKDCIEISGLGISSAKGKSTPGFGSYSAQQSGADDILMTRYLTPDDVENVKGAGLIITSGGANSHANVVAGEERKSVVRAMTEWDNGKIKAEYYELSGQKDFYRDMIEMQDLKARSIVLEEKEALIINGNDGTILAFRNDDGSNRAYQKLFAAINDKNIALIQSIIEETDNKDLGKVLEYVYYSVVGKAEYKDILNMLFKLELGDNVSEKITMLNREYSLRLKDEITSRLLEIKKITNLVSVQFTQIVRLEEDVRLLESISAQELDISGISSEFTDMKSDILNKFCEYVEKYKDKAEYLIYKNKLDTKELEEAVRLSKMAKYWNSFYGYPGIDEIVLKLDLKIENEKLKRYEVSPHEAIEAFENIFTFDEEKFGSKTVENAKYYKIINQLGIDGVRVPHGFGVSVDAMNSFLSESGKKSEYEGLIKALNEKIMIARQQKSDLLKAKAAEEAKAIARQIVELRKLSDSSRLQSEISRIFRAEDESVRRAVRSSGVGEDSVKNTYAGMGESALNILLGQLYDEIKKCGISFFSDRSVEYVIGTEAPESVKPAVLVQAMAAKEISISGAVITRDSHAQMTIEAVYGLSALMMTGHMNPDHVAVNSLGVVDYIRSTENKEKLVSLSEGGTALTELSVHEQTNRVMDNSVINKLKKIAYEIEKAEGHPVEIEFAEEGILKMVNIVQVRPAKAYVIDGYDIRKDLSINLGLVAGDVKKENFFTQVSWNGTAVPVYLKEASGENIVFSTTEKYAHLIADESFREALFDRLQDSKVIRKLPPFLVSKLKLQYKVFNIVPAYDNEIKKIVGVSENMDRTEAVRKLLSAA